ncbi:hypothetical protein AVL50_07160 [Flammeovirga sp. SJP92]|nr:hypothetical protein AVL50_07160 [Flammeovirga sp. SJP92]
MVPVREQDGRDVIRKQNAMLSYFFKIPFPERLPEEDYWEKVQQLEWLSQKGILGVEYKKE